jgi:hypothetical protein
MTDAQHEARMLNFALRSLGTIKGHLRFFPEEHVGTQLTALEVILEDMDRVLHAVVKEATAARRAKTIKE